MHQTSSRKRRRNPREDAGFFSMLTFYYTLDMFKTSNHHELEANDVYEVTRVCDAHVLGNRLQEEWQKEIKMERHSSLGRTLLRRFGMEYLFYGVLNFVVTTGIMVVRPLATGKLVSYFDNPEMSKWDAVWYACAVLLCGFIQGIFGQYYSYSLGHFCVRIRISLSSLIYRKSLMLTTESLSEATNGKIVTLLSRDIEAFDGAINVTNDLWIGLMQLCIMAYVTYREIGFSALIGIAFLVILMPIQAWMGVKAKNMRLRAAAKTDERLRRIQEVLTSIKLVKLYSWEKYYTRIVKNLRCEEMKRLRAILYLKSGIMSISAMSYRISFFIFVVTYALRGSVLNAEKAFIIIACFQSLSNVLSNSIPMCVTQMAEAKAGLKRLKGYLNLPEQEDHVDRHVQVPGKVVIIAAGARINKIQVLKDVNVTVDGSTLVGITGGIGSGKSAFLKMVVQDIDICDGQVVTHGKMSYASQEPWLFPGTIRENILFGNEYDAKRYDTVLQVCALKKDLNIFPQKDNTVVNDKGLNLSKGQQARINLARAIYKVSDIYLLDDILSSLDGKVSRHIFDNCIRDFLKDKLCFLICHSENYLQCTDKILVFKDGTIANQGTYKELKEANVSYDNTVKIEVSINKGVEELEESDEVLKCERKGDEDLLLQCEGSIENVFGEFQQKGKVLMSVYTRTVAFAGGWFVISIVIAISAASQLVTLGFDEYIRTWLDVQSQYKNVTDPSSGASLEDIAEAQATNTTTLYIYSTILVVHVLLIVVDYFAFYTMTTRCATQLHIYVFSRIMTAVTYFFDMHQSGNILNKFSKDLCFIDEFMGGIVYNTVKTTLSLGCILGAAFYIKPMLIVPAFVFFLVIWYARNQFLLTSRSLRRLEALTRAPIVGYLNGSMEGLTMIRATGIQGLLENQFDKHQDLNSSTILMVIASANAFSLWVDLLTNTFDIFVVFSFLIYNSIYESSADVGFLITQIFGLSAIVKSCATQWAEIENMMTSVERVLEYGDGDQEDRCGTDPHDWPHSGKVEYKDVRLQYPKSNSTVLHGVNFTVEPGEKIGIVGRTGAGKSSIVTALFRLYEFQGSILVDGLDITDLKVGTLRQQISLIPQDPAMFKGTVRTNLDPYEEYPDSHLWNALEDVGLKGAVESLGLSSVVKEGGLNWTIGQRQLFCLARAVLRNNRIIVLDEATSNIDPITDAFVQAAIKRLFKDYTILTIAHRINTVVNSDKIMVIDNGVVMEFDTPQILLSRKTSAFYSVAREAGFVD